MATYGCFEKPEDLGKLSLRQYIILRDEAFNIANMKLSGKYEMQNEKDKRIEAKESFDKAVADRDRMRKILKKEGITVN